MKRPVSAAKGSNNNASVEVVVFRTSSLIGHLKVYHPEEEVVREAGAEATGNFGSNPQ